MNQTYANFELILVDDGSTDNCVQIMDDYAKKDARVKVHHQENQGPIAAKDKAISLATGEYCVFLDSDDYFEPILLETVYEAIKRTNCDLCMYKYTMSMKRILTTEACLSTTPSLTRITCTNSTKLITVKQTIPFG